ncbi:hypothetical protein OC842_004003 [Tilletia horrida]|uniref:Major facilitator superfamily (MFS) profile domain-containing protein n=1 Tax=Tilletia horrida TaxID=155126 RepID=A0AAN6GA41_9BASI|nr:hypothetical protein OC842_004003 [Tilletia horrida]KAK0561468.1 hypothetical protein OC844_003200 [Tilletia horrida]
MDAYAHALHSDPKHPHNLPAWRKLAMLLTLSAMAFVSNLEAAAHLTAMPLVARSLRCTIAQAANAIGAGIIGLGTGPLLWNPLSTAVGRRPVYLISWTLFLPFIAYCALSPNLSNFLAARFMAGFCSSAAQTIPAASIAEVWSPKSRGTAIAAWTLAVITGPLIAPLVCAAIISRPASWRWMYWACLIMACAVLLAALLFIPETLYTAARDSSAEDEATATDGNLVLFAEARDGQEGGAGSPLSFEKKGGEAAERRRTADVARARSDGESDVATVEHGVHLGAGGRVGAAYLPWREPARFFKTVIRPFRQALYLPILITCVWSAWIFTISVGTTVVTPQIFERPPFNYTPVSVGLLFLASIMGAILGKLAGGRAADWTIAHFTRRSKSGRREPELRLPALVLPTCAVLVGTILYGDGLQRAESWVEAIVGTGIFYFGTSAIQGIAQTYCVECDLKEAASTIPLYNFIKCVFGFAAPFFIPEWGFRGLRIAYVVQGVTSAGAGAVIITGLLIAGRQIRRAQGLPVLA